MHLELQKSPRLLQLPLMLVCNENYIQGKQHQVKEQKVVIQSRQIKLLLQ